METMRNLLGPLINLSGVLFTIYYVFALVGMFMFGGLIRKNSEAIINDPNIPNTYHLDNFNDLISSFVTLFTLMVVNNWFVQVAMYVDVMDGNTYYRFYFCLFYYFAVVVGINIVVAFAIDMYSSIERLESAQQKMLEDLEQELTMSLTKSANNSNSNSLASSISSPRNA
jgi:ABC-type multidrug transport system fused ATPase/permease subunit